MSKTGTRKDKEMKSTIELADGSIARVVTPSKLQQAFEFANLFSTSPSFPPNDFDRVYIVEYEDRYELVYAYNGDDKFVITVPFTSVEGKLETVL